MPVYKHFFFSEKYLEFICFFLQQSVLQKYLELLLLTEAKQKRRFTFQTLELIFLKSNMFLELKFHTFISHSSLVATVLNSLSL